MKKIHPILAGLAGLIILVFLGFLIWASNPLGPMPQAFTAMNPTEKVSIASSPWLTFSPAQTKATTGLVFYPGGRVDYRSYAPMGRWLAEKGYLVVIPKMPLNLAVFGADIAEDIFKYHPEINKWAVGGHSLGGAMAAKYIYDHPGTVAGLVLLASYPSTANDLSKPPVKVISLYGSEDQLATPEKVRSSIPLLPADTWYSEIPGANHAQMGWYGLQPGDGTPKLSRGDQQMVIVDALAQFLDQIQD